MLRAKNGLTKTTPKSQKRLHFDPPPERSGYVDKQKMLLTILTFFSLNV